MNGQRGLAGLLAGVSLLVGLPAVGGAEGQPQRQAPFAQLRENPQAYVGAAVVVGGEIVRWTPSAQGFRLQVLQRQLDSWLRPQRLAVSGGGFWVEYPEQLGPLSVLTPYITVIGEVVGAEQGLPVIRAQRAWLFPLSRGMRGGAW